MLILTVPSPFVLPPLQCSADSPRTRWVTEIQQFLQMLWVFFSFFLSATLPWMCTSCNSAQGGGCDSPRFLLNAPTTQQHQSCSVFHLSKCTVPLDCFFCGCFFFALCLSQHQFCSSGDEFQILSASWGQNKCTDAVFIELMGKAWKCWLELMFTLVGDVMWQFRSFCGCRKAVLKADWCCSFIQQMIPHYYVWAEISPSQDVTGDRSLINWDCRWARVRV